MQLMFILKFKINSHTTGQSDNITLL